MELTRKGDGGRLTLAISGKCTVEHAAPLREALLEAVAADKQLSLDVSGVEEADITFLQLVLATALTLQREGGALSRTGSVSEAAREAARVAGFDQTPQLKTFFVDEERDG